MQNASDYILEVCTDATPMEVSGLFVDLHCHCLPGLDDGPELMDDAVALCAMLAADNIGLMVATPHQLGRFEGNTPAGEVRRAVRCLNRELSMRGIDLKVLPGGEVRLDERIPELLTLDKILTLADMNRHVLVELPDEVFIDVKPLLVELRSLGVDIVIAHPERNLPLLRQPRLLRGYLDCGASLQVTAGSLTGRFGREAMQAAWNLVALGWTAFVATDAHDRGTDRSYMTVAFRMIALRLGWDLARLLCVENPRKIVSGESPLQLLSLHRQEVG